MFDICIVGHITEDRVKGISSTEITGPGGTAYYMPVALSLLGLKCLVVTKLARDKGYFLDILREKGINVWATESSQTTVFENVYDSPNSRRQWVRAIAQPFAIQDVQDAQARVFHLGPLTSEDMQLEILEYLSGKSRISLDVQGFVRRCVMATDYGKPRGKVELVNWAEKERALAFVSILKANEQEAGVLSEEGDLRGEKDLEKAARKLSKLGPTEVVITRADKRSLIYSQGESYWIPSYRQKQPLYPTGCGDTYMAGYLFQRLKMYDISRAGRFAAGIASLKLRNFGPFKETEKDVWQFLEKQKDMQVPFR